MMMGLSSAAIAIALAVIAPTAAQSRDLSGDYVMQGKGVGDSDLAYVGTCNFKAIETLYDVACFNADTRHTYSGRGIADGDQFSIVIGDLLKGDHGSAYLGEYLVVYRVAADGRMTGRWVHALSGTHGLETLTPKK